MSKNDVEKIILNDAIIQDKNITGGIVWTRDGNIYSTTMCGYIIEVESSCFEEADLALNSIDSATADFTSISDALSVLPWFNFSISKL